jgi:acyl carrier protein
MSEEDIHRKLTKILEEQLGTDRDDCYPEQTLEKLGMDSLDQVELVMAIEEEFGLAVEDDITEKWVTFGDVSSYLQEQLA